MIIIQNPTSLDDELHKSILKLIPQLKIQQSLPTLLEINCMFESDSSKLFVARYPLLTSPIVGMLTLAIYRVPSGIRAHIEDLIVDLEFRNKGIAKALIKTAIQSAQEEGANGVSLTSHPQRLAANKLYRNLGFKKWKTNLYFYKIE